MAGDWGASLANSSDFLFYHSVAKWAVLPLILYTDTQFAITVPFLHQNGQVAFLFSLHHFLLYKWWRWFKHSQNQHGYDISVDVAAKSRIFGRRLNTHTHTSARTHEHERAWKDWKQLISGILSSGAKSHLLQVKSSCCFETGPRLQLWAWYSYPPPPSWAQTPAHGLRRLCSSNTSGDSPAFLPPLLTSKHEYMQNSRFLVRTFSCCSSKMMKYVSSFGKLVKQCFSWYWGFITFYEWEFLSPGGMFALHDCPNSHKGHIGWMICPILYLFYM